MVPHNACRDVTVYGYGKCTNTTLLYSVRERLKKKYRTSQNSWLFRNLFSVKSAQKPVNADSD